MVLCCVRFMHLSVILAYSGGLSVVMRLHNESVTIYCLVF